MTENKSEQNSVEQQIEVYIDASTIQPRPRWATTKHIVWRGLPTGMSYKEMEAQRGGAEIQREEEVAR